MGASSDPVAYPTADDVDSSSRSADHPAIPNFVTKLSVVALQILGLWGLNLAGVWVVDATSLPIPGNLLGMVALYALLALGWFDATGSFLIKTSPSSSSRSRSD